MKLSIVLLFVFFAYLAQTSNICFGHDGICTNINNCNPGSGCLGILNEILRISPTMHDVWQTTISTFGGSWTVVQTQSANWYSNWGTAAICNCNGVVNIFVQQ
jgi:hypothetical protein